MKTLKSDISEASKVHVDCLKDSYDKNDMKEKVNELVRLHEAIQEIIFRTNPNSYLGT